ncbi:glycogenin glucosyltransferase [Coemansia thaxteri]|nr:glycogenin glucosyltransferase [Coemansia thaxteri]KAJ2471132.1 glycogenin glucosyltransferase [Coemansia sp. RSA 2322]
MAASGTDQARVCFATLLTTDSYMHGALTLAASLRATGTHHEIICLVADGQLSRSALERLARAFDRLVTVPLLNTNDASSLALLGRPDLGSTVTKIGVWALTDYERVAFLDADTLVLASIDSLLCLDLPSELAPGDVHVGRDFRANGGMLNEGLLAAAPDLGWPDCFNSGVFVAKPSDATHSGLLSLLATQGSFDGGDQGLLNAYFADWSRADHTRRLPFAYNTTSTSFYTYAPAFAHFSSAIKVVHFIGAHKPWKWHRALDGSLLLGCTAATPYDSNASPFAVFVEKWWNVHDEYVSLWSPDKGDFNVDVALSLSEQYASADVLQPSTTPQTVLLPSSHAMDDAWKRAGTDYSNVEARTTDNDGWSEFMPASDFALSPSTSGPSSSHASSVQLHRNAD